ncbi:hypothetical protein V2J09_009944 [Rumex salicifolius]
MMVEKDDLGLSLGLSCYKTTSNSSIKQNNVSPFQLNLMPSLLSSSSSPSALPFAFAAAPDRNPWSDSLSDRRSEEPRKAKLILHGVDGNRLPAITAAEDEEAGVSSPNSTISSLSGKRIEREATGCELDTEQAHSRGGSDEDDGDAARKKLRLSKDQSAVLEDSFKENHTLNPKQKLALANRLGLRPRQVEVWFQNRRARTKLKQTEFDCEFMKKCCEQLTEENLRLQKEVHELRSLKLSPEFYMHMTPPTTLTMCPSCERVAPPNSATATAHPQPRESIPSLRRNYWGVL